MPPSMRWSSVNTLPQVCAKNLCPRPASSRAFSSTPRHNVTKQRRHMYAWLESRGAALREPLPGSTNYLGAYDKLTGQLKRKSFAAEEADKADKDSLSDGLDADSAQGESEEGESTKEATELQLPPERRNDLMPFPSNPNYYSTKVLSDDFREVIWTKIMKEGLSVREVSARTNVEMSRVGAVVRLKEIEKEWKRTGKATAQPYAKAVMGMLPQTFWKGNRSWHEEINNLPVHEATTVQIFEPTSESRVFTRVDAAKVFDEKLLPPDLRIPHPQLVEKQRDILAGLSDKEIIERNQEREDIELEKRQKVLDYRAKKEAEVKRVDTGRWEFRFREANVEHIGADGRGSEGVGWRYGKPHMDRSKGQVKIPTRVE